MENKLVILCIFVDKIIVMPLQICPVILKDGTMCPLWFLLTDIHVHLLRGLKRVLIILEGNKS